MLLLNFYVEQAHANAAGGIITEIVWPLFCRNQIYDTDITSVRIGFVNNAVLYLGPALFAKGQAYVSFKPCQIIGWIENSGALSIARNSEARHHAMKEMENKRQLRP
ncbi:hypothetical protein TNCV_4783661 [Trichonephila clavipes]|nr:hypothetical protein TNCV_4783661 [Trichonephila clavipes]